MVHQGFLPFGLSDAGMLRSQSGPQPRLIERRQNSEAVLGILTGKDIKRRRILNIKQVPYQ